MCLHKIINCIRIANVAHYYRIKELSEKREWGAGREVMIFMTKLIMIDDLIKGVSCKYSVYTFVAAMHSKYIVSIYIY